MKMQLRWAEEAAPNLEHITNYLLRSIHQEMSRSPETSWATRRRPDSSGS